MGKRKGVGGEEKERDSVHDRSNFLHLGASMIASD